MLSIIRNDSDLNAFFSRQLEFIYAQTYDIKYADLKARDFVPVSNQADPGATNVTYRQFDRRGRAKLIGHNAKDVPRVDVLAREFPRPVRDGAAAYGFSYKEVRAAALAGLSLEARKASAARRAIEELLDEVASIGAPEFGIPTGFINDADVPVETLGAADDFQTLVAGGNNRRIVAIISEAYQRIRNRTRDRAMPNTLLLPTAEHALISTTPFGDNSDKTIMDFMMANFPMLEAIEPWYRLDDGGAAGVTRAILYPRNSETLTQEIPSEFVQLPPQEDGLETIIHTLASTAGTAIYYPVECEYIDGV